jgi:Flp pilus assembly protein TadD
LIYGIKNVFSLYYYQPLYSIDRCTLGLKFPEDSELTAANNSILKTISKTRSLNCRHVFTQKHEKNKFNQSYLDIRYNTGYCLAKLGRYEDSVKEHRRADELEPDNYEHLNDLGYSLLEAGKFDEAEEVLKRSISLAPPDYEFPYNNLSELKKKRKETKPER